MSEKMILKCKDCDLVVTNELTELKDISNLNNQEREGFIPKGYYFISDAIYSMESKGTIIVNNDDVINSKTHLDFTIGCCGLDGKDGMNKICNNGHEIGSEYSECWMTHYTTFEFGLINFEE